MDLFFVFFYRNCFALYAEYAQKLDRDQDAAADYSSSASSNPLLVRTVAGLHVLFAAFLERSLSSLYHIDSLCWRSRASWMLPTC